MDILDSLVIPQSAENLTALQYLMGLAKIIFTIYAGVLFGSSLFSVYYDLLSKSADYDRNKRAAKDFVDLITGSKMFAFGLGIVPFLGIIIIYQELLSGSGAPVVGWLIISFVLFIASILFIYAYKHALHIDTLLKKIKNKTTLSEDDEDFDDLDVYNKAASSVRVRSGFWTFILILVSMRIYLAATSIAENPADWDTGFWGMMFSGSTIIRFIHFIASGLAVTGIAFVVKKFYWDKHTLGKDEIYNTFIKRFSLSVALIFTAVQPLFLVLNLMLTPKEALSSFMFGITIIVMALVLIAAHMIYNMIRKRSPKFAVSSFYVVILVVAFVIVKEQVAFSVANKQNQLVMANSFEDMHAEMLAQSGRGGVEINAAEIYEVKCTACHMFDERKVGPPHRDVLPKYMDDQAALAKFLLNPVKVDPDYDAMPSQGLKPKEAEALAEYMITEFGPRLK